MSAYKKKEPSRFYLTIEKKLEIFEKKEKNPKLSVRTLDEEYVGKNQVFKSLFLRQVLPKKLNFNPAQAPRNWHIKKNTGHLKKPCFSTGSCQCVILPFYASRCIFLDPSLNLGLFWRFVN